ncbi:MAG: hypothetical protein CL748_00060 [Chloroflexi bacterium]|nr:hypothetical protein [Chloroflexota bacterium]
MKIDISKKFTKELCARALNFIDILTSSQKEKLFFSFSDKERFNWHYTPIKKYGLTISEMNEGQQNMAFNIIKLLLSEMGHQTFKEIIELEKILYEWEKLQGEKNHWIRDSGIYYFAIFGDPNNDGTPWGIRVNGHHILITVNFSSKFISFLPSFFGANPAEILHGKRKGEKTLLKEENLARSFIKSMNFHQSTKAILHENAPADIITQNVIHVKKFHIEDGIKYSSLFDSQKLLLKTLISHYFSRFNNLVFNEYIEKLSNLEQTRFAWAGSISPKKPHYYSIYHPEFIIEYDNTQNDSNHIHTVIRDIKNDWGENLLSLHYEKFHI